MIAAQVEIQEIDYGSMQQSINKIAGSAACNKCKRPDVQRIGLPHFMAGYRQSNQREDTNAKKKVVSPD